MVGIEVDKGNFDAEEFEVAKKSFYHVGISSLIKLVSARAPAQLVSEKGYHFRSG